jgi:hypothetical protein
MLSLLERRYLLPAACYLLPPIRNVLLVAGSRQQVAVVVRYVNATQCVALVKNAPAVVSDDSAARIVP